MTHKPGKTMYLADTLSRSYLPESADMIPDVSVNFLSYLPISDEMYNKFQLETANFRIWYLMDGQMRKVRFLLICGRIGLLEMKFLWMEYYSNHTS